MPEHVWRQPVGHRRHAVAQGEVAHLGAGLYQSAHGAGAAELVVGVCAQDEDAAEAVDQGHRDGVSRDEEGRAPGCPPQSHPAAHRG